MIQKTIRHSQRLHRLLAASSLAALMIGAGMPSAFAACSNAANNFTGIQGAISNSASRTCLSVSNAVVGGNIFNTGKISPFGIAITNSTVLGNISDTGLATATIAGGISVDSQSTIFGITGGIFVQLVSTFGGGISTAGKISGPTTGIFVQDALTFSGGITNAGAITARVDGINVTNTGVTPMTFSGGVTNSGSLSVGGIGIVVQRLSVFSGGISNAGVITAGAAKDAISVQAVTNVSGGIANNGTLSAGATAIAVQTVSLFSGNVANNGTITAATGNGIHLGNTGAINISTFGGSVLNAGTINAAKTGILLQQVSVFTGGVTSTGSISAGGDGIGIGAGLSGGVLTFAGGVSTAGVITAHKTALFIGGLMQSFGGGVVNSGILNSATGNGINVTNILTTFSGGISNSGTISAGGSSFTKGGILVQGVANFSGGITNSGTINAPAEDGILVTNGGTFTGGITNSGLINAAGIVVESESSFGNGIINAAAGTISGGIDVVLVPAFSGGITNNGTVLGEVSITLVSAYTGGITNTGKLSGNTGISLGFGVGTFSGAIVNSGAITGTNGTAINVSNAHNAITIDQEAGTITGAINLSANADQLNVSGGVINGNILGGGSLDAINFALGSGTFTYRSAFNFSNISQVNVSSGTVILDGIDQATSTTVTGGTLVIGDASNPAAKLETSTVTVSGGALAGTGTIDPAATAVTIGSGGTLAPGAPGSIGTLTIGGGLTINSGSFYDVAVNDTTASKTLVNLLPGTATISGGTVMVTPQFTTLGAHGGTTFTILTASAGRTGTFAAVTSNAANFTGALSLSYDADDVFLNVGKGFVLLPTLSGATVNEQNVFNGINNAIVAGDTVPAGFNQLLGLSGASYLNALNQLDGEDGTGAERGAFDLMNEFLGLMLDPSGYSSGSGGGAGALGFAPDQEASLPPDIALAYAGVFKAPPAPIFQRRWTTWGAGFGGSATANGDPVIGSSNVTTSTYGYAGGMDYHYSPDTVLGFALGGGGTNWNLANALGTGRSDAFLAGIHGVTHAGPAYVAAALAFANNWFTTNRTALDDQLAAKFQGQSYAARLEGGYRFALPMVHGAAGITPYAAIQAQNFHTPSYSETDLTGGGFGLSYNAMSGTDTRSELGARFDDLTALSATPLILRARLAWAHDWIGNPALNAAFESLPGSSFTVNGAPIPHDSALTSAGAQLFFAPNWSFTAKFDGEFASGSQLYAGTGTLRYTW